jgi:sodium/hydrogen antiporter
VLDLWLAIGAGLAVLISAISRKLDRLPLSEPLVGLTVGVLVGPQLLGLVVLPEARQLPLLAMAAELTLAIALMAIALRYPIDVVRRRSRSLVWLLGVVMPAMAIVSAALGWALLGIGFALALVLGAVLSPTDPVLASSVVSGEPAEQTLPARLRENLSLESGFNDGLAFPFVLLALAAVGSLAARDSALLSAWGVFGAIGMGWLMGRISAWILTTAERHGDIDTSHRLLYSLVLAFAALGIGNLAGTGGLLAVFVTGLVFNAHTSAREREDEETIDEGVNRILVLPLFVILGVALPWAGWEDLGWSGAAFAAAILLLRRLPAVLMLRRRIDAARLADGVWLGWFGPIGVAALFYLADIERFGFHEPVVWHAATLTIAASIVAHGLSGSPGRWLYGRLTAAG